MRFVLVFSSRTRIGEGGQTRQTSEKVFLGDFDAFDQIYELFVAAFLTKLSGWRRTMCPPYACALG
ncbi:MAG: hypothetical protein WKF61_10785, partial [Luteimonas sp.]